MRSNCFNCLCQAEIILRHVQLRTEILLFPPQFALQKAAIASEAVEPLDILALVEFKSNQKLPKQYFQHQPTVFPIYVTTTTGKRLSTKVWDFKLKQVLEESIILSISTGSSSRMNSARTAFFVQTPCWTCAFPNLRAVIFNIFPLLCFSRKGAMCE